MEEDFENRTEPLDDPDSNDNGYDEIAQDIDLKK